MYEFSVRIPIKRGSMKKKIAKFVLESVPVHKYSKDADRATNIQNALRQIREEYNEIYGDPKIENPTVYRVIYDEKGDESKDMIEMQYPALLPELQKCLKGGWIKHKFLTTGICHPVSNAILNEMVVERQEAYKQFLADKKFRSAIGIVEKPFQLDCFMNEIRHLCSDKEYWEILSAVYTLKNTISDYLSEWLILFRDSRPGKEYFMNEEEREFFKKLPERLTIYRGCFINKKYKYRDLPSNEGGISYTLSKEKAEWYAKRFIALGGKAFIIKKTVNKSDCFAYLNGREEEEIIYLKSDCNDREEKEIFYLDSSPGGFFPKEEPGC